MTSKKKLGSKLANSVRQVKLQREQAPVVPAKTAVAVKPTARPASPAAPTRPAAPDPAKKSDMNSKTKLSGQTELNRLHPQRVWPD